MYFIRGKIRKCYSTYNIGNICQNLNITYMLELLFNMMGATSTH